MCIVRLCERTPSATPLAVGFVPGRRLRFHKVSSDGSSKADAFATGSDDDRIWGVVYELAEVDKPIIDGFEGLGAEYGESLVRVETSGGHLEAWLYVALPHTLDAAVLPYRWYRDLCFEGTLDHPIPADHARRIELQPFIEDADPVRRAANEQLLGRARAARLTR